MKRCLLLLAALATIPSTFALPTGEFPIARSVTGTAPYDRRNIMVAANDDLSLAAWEDFRVDPNLPPRVWVSRFRNFNGQVLDPTGISIAALPAGEGSALRAVGTDGTDFIVAWTEGGHLRFAIVRADGQVVAAPDPVIAAQFVSITFIGDGYAIALTSTATPNNPSQSIDLLLVDKQGAVIQRLGGLVHSAGVMGIASAVSNNNAFLYLAWSDNADAAVHTASYLLSQLRESVVTAPPQVPPGTPIGPAPPFIAMASNGTDMLVAWVDVQGIPPGYRVQRFDGNGLPIGASLFVASAPLVPFGPAVAWDGSQYVVGFQAANGGFQVVRYESNGNREDTLPIEIAPPSVTGLALAATRTTPGTVMAWLTSQPSGAQVAADFFTPPGLLAYPQANLSTSFVDRSDAVVLWRGDHYLAAWRETSNITRIAVGRVSSEGVLLDPNGIDVSVGSSSSPPVMATNGRTAVVAWVDFGGVAASFVDETGHVIRKMFDFPGGKPSVNWNGQQYLVVWRSSQGQLLGLRMTGAGALIDTNPVTIAPVTGDPVLGWTGNAYVVTFPETLPFPIFPPEMNLWAQLISPTLTAIGSRMQISEARVGTPVVADGPAGSLIVWARTAGGVTTLRGVRAVNGAILDPLNGFAIGTASDATVYGSAAGWGVVNGPFVWVVSRNGAVSARFFELTFVPVGARSSVVFGGPAVLVVYRRPPVGSEQMMQVVARYLLRPPRERSVRH